MKHFTILLILLLILNGCIKEIDKNRINLIAEQLYLLELEKFNKTGQRISGSATNYQLSQFGPSKGYFNEFPNYFESLNCKFPEKYTGHGKWKIQGEITFNELGQVIKIEIINDSSGGNGLEILTNCFMATTYKPFSKDMSAMYYEMRYIKTFYLKPGEPYLYTL